MTQQNMEHAVEGVDDTDDPTAGLSDRARITAPSAVDLWVAGRVKLRRVEQGMSQRGLAAEVGLSKNQFMKIEAGDNRLTCGRLFDIAQALRVPPAYFFDGMPDASGIDAQAEHDFLALVKSGDTADVVRLYTRLTKEQQGTIKSTMENFVAGNDAIMVVHAEA
jgi:transcriptional regulator with XRE-family HTH domain